MADKRRPSTSTRLATRAGDVPRRLSDDKVVDSSRERVEPDDDVHRVGVNGVFGNLAEILELVSVVELGARDIVEGGVGFKARLG